MRARLELGLSLAATSSPSEAAEAIRAALPAVAPGARATVLAELGEALLASGDSAAAWEYLRAAVAEGGEAAAPRARGRAATALHAGGLASEAVAAWEPLSGDRLASELDPSSRVSFAEDLHATGDRTRAAEILRAIWGWHPERPDAARAERLLAAWRQGGEPIPEPTGDERLARAWRLLSLGQAEDGRAELALASSARPPAAPESVAIAEGSAFLSLGRTSDAALAVEPLAQARDPGARRGAALIRARAAARERRIPEAIAAWRQVAALDAEIPGMPRGAQSSLDEDAAYYAAWLRFDLGDFDRAAAELSRLARENPGSRRADDARWFAAWALIRKGAHREAEPALRRAERGAATPRARYWRALVSRSPEAARQLLEAVAAEDPRGYYGLLACARLRSSGAPCPAVPLAPGAAPPELEELPEASVLRRAALLVSLGMRDAGIAELTALVGSRDGRRASPLAAELAHFAGDPLLPFRIARDRLGLSGRTLAWAFPEAWPHLVGRASSVARVDPALLRAVMRRESGFQRDVRSPAGAVGLLQVIPPTAARLASVLGIPEPVEEQLEDASINVPLGAGYLSLLLERFGEPLLAIAAYNAGPNAVLRWTDGRPAMPLDAWVESIPYRETRQYVRAVVENWIGARLAAGQPPPDVDPTRLVPAPAPGIAF